MAYKQSDGYIIYYSRMPVVEDHSCIEVPFEALSGGELAWKEYISSLSPEDLEKQRKYDRNRLKTWYEQSKDNINNM